MEIPNYEFRIVEGRATDVQKILNQWKNKYALHVVGMAVPARDYITLLIQRQKLEEQDDTDEQG